MAPAMGTVGTPRICTTDMEMPVVDVHSMMGTLIDTCDKVTCRVQVLFPQWVVLFEAIVQPSKASKLVCAVSLGNMLLSSIYATAWWLDCSFDCWFNALNWEYLYHFLMLLRTTLFSEFPALSCARCGWREQSPLMMWCSRNIRFPGVQGRWGSVGTSSAHHVWFIRTKLVFSIIQPNDNKDNWINL